MAFEPEVVSNDVLLRTLVFDVERLVFRHDGELYAREIARHRGAVAVLAFDGERVVLVRQWRASLRRPILEVPAGRCDVEGEGLEATGRRELLEEAGVVAERFEPLLDLVVSPGWSDERIVVFLATGLTEVAAEPCGPEEEAMEVLRVGLDDAVAMVVGGACDAKTAAAVLALKVRLAT